MNWVVGVDGGGTKTLLALANPQGQVLGPIAAEGINPFDNSDWQKVLRGVVAQCPRPLSEIAHATLGLPGYGEVPAISQAQEQLAAQLFAHRSAVNDVEVAFVGALAGAAGVLVLSGTGSMAWAGAGQKQIRTGGWGDGFGDEGSAFWIGQQALSDLSKARDGRIQDPAFDEGMMQALGLNSDAELLAWYYGLGHARSQVARLAKTVDGLAEAGNATARAILLRAANELSLLAQTAHRLLSEPSAQHFSYAGSVFNSRTVRQAVMEQVKLGSWQSPLLSPIGGALLHAAKQAGWPVETRWIKQIHNGLKDF